MNKSESIIELAKALAKAQGEMGGAVKNKENPFFKSSYADLGAVIAVCKEPFAKNGLAFVQQPITNESGAGCETILMHESGEWISETLILPMAKVDPQTAGGAITYARRYSLAAIAGIPQVDDDAQMANDVTSIETQWIEHNQCIRDNFDTINTIKEELANENQDAAMAAWRDLNKEAMETLWKAPTKGGIFETHERNALQNNGRKAA